MSDEALLELVYHGREERNLEYKSSMSWQATSTKAKIAKSVMAMANIPDGGAIVIGVVKEGETYNPRGMEQDHVSSFRQDDVMEYINQKYADPYVELTVRTVDRDNKQFVVIQVSEFGQLPIICRNDGLENLLRGAIFTRSRVKHETIQVRSQTEMREILDLAVDKEIRRLRNRGLITSVGV
ncbi:MAG: ATP-binding protein, partial [Chloroflexi bacterium]|nr:ATP-binding protein [Chloroflexota bacterium]